jgi:hypothetical protein
MLNAIHLMLECNQGPKMIFLAREPMKAFSNLCSQTFNLLDLESVRLTLNMLSPQEKVDRKWTVF